MTQRLYYCPSQYQGNGISSKTLASPWDFATDKDLKLQNEISGTAQDEIDWTIYMPASASVASGYAIALCQKFNDPGIDDVCWHICMHGQFVSSATNVTVYPFFAQNEDADADTTRFQILGVGSRGLTGFTELHTTSEVIRNKNGFAGAEDDNGVVIGILFVNNSGTAHTISGQCHISVHPNSIPMPMSKPGI